MGKYLKKTIINNELALVHNDIVFHSQIFKVHQIEQPQRKVLRSLQNGRLFFRIDFAVCLLFG